MSLSLAKFGISEKNEKFRSDKGYPTIKSMLDGTPVESIIPKPLKCRCGHYPFITKIGMKNHMVRCQGCNITYEFAADYSASILQWNLKPNVPFPLKSKCHFHPYIDVEVTDDLWVIKAATKSMSQKLFKQRSTKSKREKNLVTLMIDWNNYAYRMAQLLTQNPSKFIDR
jgi:hypothetical protein